MNKNHINTIVTAKRPIDVHEMHIIFINSKKYDLKNHERFSGFNIQTGNVYLREGGEAYAQFGSSC